MIRRCAQAESTAGGNEVRTNQDLPICGIWESVTYTKAGINGTHKKNGGQDDEDTDVGTKHQRGTAEIRNAVSLRNPDAVIKLSFSVLASVQA